MLDTAEQEIYEKFKALRSASGTHSPSVATLLEMLGRKSFEIDACFLSNPYATDLFFSNLLAESRDEKFLRDLLEYYPPQNKQISKHLENYLGISRDYVLVNNGAIESIQAILHNFVGKKLGVIIPTFSSYYEFVNSETGVCYYQLSKENNYELDVDHYLDWVAENQPSSIVVINPNNPTGGYVLYRDIVKILDNCKHLETVIIDESFIHFAYEDKVDDIPTVSKLVEHYPNLAVVKSMSKDFGVAGIRAGYTLMNPARVSSLLERSYLWNINGLSSYFFTLFKSDSFLEDYKGCRLRYLDDMNEFGKKLAKLDAIKAYPSRANFYLVELQATTADTFSFMLLNRNGVYVRNCEDKLAWKASLSESLLALQRKIAISLALFKN